MPRLFPVERDGDNQAGARATDRPKIGSGRDEPRADDQPAERAERYEHRERVRGEAVAEAA